MTFVALEKLHKLHDGYRKCVRIAGVEWLLLQESGQLYCIANQCPHGGAPLQNATLNTAFAHQIRLRCPQHGMEFDLRTGRPIHPASCAASLRFLPLLYDGNQVGVSDGCA